MIYDHVSFSFEACNLSVQIGSRQTNNGHRREMSWAIPLPIKGRLLGISINQEHIRSVAGEEGSQIGRHRRFARAAFLIDHG